MRSSVRTALFEASHRLKSIVQTIDQAYGQAELLLAHVLGRDRVWLIGHGEEMVSVWDAWRFRRFIARRLRREPLAYVMGKIEFCGRLFLVNKQVLIPRPETEELIELAKAWIKKDAHHAFVTDIGTGSGAIAISLVLDLPDVPVLATDVSLPALQMARKNADLLDASVSFVQADLLNDSVRHIIDKQTADRLAFLVNLPYVPENDRKDLMPEVIKYEPSGALFSGADGLDSIRLFLQQAGEFYVNDHREMAFFFEFDPSQTKTLLKEASYHFPQAHVRVLSDACGRDRFLEIITSPIPQTSGHLS